MEKIFAIFSALILVFSLVAVPIMAQTLDPEMLAEGCTIRTSFSIGEETFQAGDVISGNPGDDDYHEGWSVICMLGTVYYVTNWIFYIILVAVMIMILYAAFLFLTSSGSPEKAGKATKVITYAIIGMVIGLLARAIPAAVRYFVGMG